MSRTTIAALLAILAVSAANVPGALILHDGFNYAGNGNLAGSYGGSGIWAGTWKADGTSITLAEAGLAYPGLPTIGRAVEKITGGSSMQQASYRSWSSGAYTADGSELWFSFLFATDTPGTSGGAELRLHPVGGTNLSTGSGVYIWGNNTISVRMEGTDSIEPRLNYDRGESNLVVGRLDFSDTAGDDSIRVWVNPALDAAPTTGGVGMKGDFSATSNVYMRGGSTWIGSVDEFRMGTTFDSVVAPPVNETVAYWRFEGYGTDWLLDSSGNGHHLTAQGSPSQIVLPETGPGSAFHNPIPQIVKRNLAAADLAGSSWLTAPDNDAFTSNTFTIEAYLNIDTLDLSSTPIVAGHFNSTGDQRAWFLAIAPTSGRLRLALSDDGTAAEVITSALAIEAGKDYYLAAAVNVADTSSDGIIFYLQDLTDGGPLLSENQSHDIDMLHNSTALFAIGSQGRSGGGNFFPGIIDEVRFSNVMLSPDQLLVIPEPGTWLLLAFGSLTLLIVRRRWK